MILSSQINGPLDINFTALLAIEAKNITSSLTKLHLRTWSSCSIQRQNI